MSDFDDFFNSLGDIFAGYGSDLYGGTTPSTASYDSLNLNQVLGIVDEVARLDFQRKNSYLSQQELEVHRQQMSTGAFPKYDICPKGLKK